MAFVVVPGTETLAAVEDGDLVLVLQDNEAQSEADAESVEEFHAADTEFSINFDVPSGKTPYALYCMADCRSWSISGNTMTANVRTVRQVKSDGTEYASALGFLTSFSPNMVDVQGSHFSGVGVHYSDMSSTDPQQLSKKAGYSVNGFTGHSATFKMFAPNAVLDWMGIPDPKTQWTGYLGDEVTDTVVTKTQVAGGWIMEFSFTFASNKKPGAGRPLVESNDSGYWAEKFSGVVFNDSSGGNVSTGGNSFDSGADYVTLSDGFGDESNTVCITPPNGFSVTGLHVNQTTWYPGASCYTSADGARVDFGISRDTTAAAPIPTVAPTATPSGQTQGTLTASGGTVSNAGSGVTLTFASGAVADGATATIRPLASGETSAIGAGFSLVDTVVEVVVRDASGNVMSDFSSNPVRMCFDYTAAQLLTAGGDTANLEVVRNPGLADEGAVASNRAVDSSAQQICVDVTQFSTWTVAARVPTALPVTGSSVYTAALVGIAAVLFLSGGLALGWRRRR
jgi:LPXTG-motif cell wall-anchored protein